MNQLNQIYKIPLLLATLVIIPSCAEEEKKESAISEARYHSLDHRDYASSGCRFGDANKDGDVNKSDDAPFRAAIGVASLYDRCLDADINGLVDEDGDYAAFLKLLQQGS